MDATSTKARTTKSKSRQEDFTRLKTKHKARKENKVELEINMERMGSKIIELHNLKKFKDHVIMDNFSYDFQENALESSGKMERKINLLNLLTDSLPLDGGKVVIGETIKLGYYTQSGINPKPGQRVIDVIKEYGEFIPLMKGKMISASQLLERFF
jgi:ATP-binding cassette subfamily F protein uup